MCWPHWRALRAVIEAGSLFNVYGEARRFHTSQLTWMYDKQQDQSINQSICGSYHIQKDRFQKEAGKVRLHFFGHCSSKMFELFKITAFVQHAFKQWTKTYIVVVDAL